MQTDPKDNASDRWYRLSTAITNTLTIHVNQERKGNGTPYTGHLLGVTSLIIEAGGDEEQVMAGILHGAIEDVGFAREEEIATRLAHGSLGL